MRRYPGRSRRLFEAPLPDLTPRRAQPPAGSTLASEYSTAGYIAAYSAEVASWSVVGIEPVVRAFVSAVPAPAVYALRPRALVLSLARRLAGLPAGGGPASLSTGGAIGGFRVLALTPNEVVLTPDAWLLDVRVSLRLENDWTHKWLTVTTVARARDALGAVALSPFVRLHARLMPAIVGAVAVAIDTPRPRPPWEGVVGGS